MDKNIAAVALAKAVVERQRQLRIDLAFKRQVAQAARIDAEEKEKIASAVEQELAALDEYLKENPPAVDSSNAEIEALFPSKVRSIFRASIRHFVTVEAENLLKQKSSISTGDVVKALAAKNMRLGVVNPHTRIAQILGEDSRFKNDRSVGWFLTEKKGEGPAGTGPSGATESDGS